jgi:hypothetical protein
LFFYGGNAFCFAAAKQSATLEELARYCGLEQAGEYTLGFSDGTEQALPAAELASWTLGVQDERAFIRSETSGELWDLKYINVK